MVTKGVNQFYEGDNTKSLLVCVKKIYHELVAKYLYQRQNRYETFSKDYRNTDISSTLLTLYIGKTVNYLSLVSFAKIRNIHQE